MQSRTKTFAGGIVVNELRRAMIGDSRVDARFEVALERNDTYYPAKNNTRNRYSHRQKHHNVYERQSTCVEKKGNMLTVSSPSHGSNSKFFGGKHEQQAAASQEKAPQSLSWWPRRHN